jgi:hypothetical protein
MERNKNNISKLILFSPPSIIPILIILHIIHKEFNAEKSKLILKHNKPIESCLKNMCNQGST